MSDVITCPTCQTMLRVPASATTVRCPQCKSVLGVSAPAPPPPAIPLPLPFAKPRSKPAAKNQLAKKVTKKAVLVDEAAEKVEAEDLAKAEHRQKVTAAVEEMEERDEIKLEKFERLQDLMVHSRRAVIMFTWAARCQMVALAIVLTVLLAFMTSVLFEVVSSLQGRGSIGVGAILGATVFAALPLGVILSVLASGLTGYGMVSVSIGTKRARYLGYIGCAVCLLHVFFVIMQAARAMIGLATREFEVNASDPLWVQIQPVFDLFGMVTDLPLLSEQPTRLFWRHPVSYFGIFAAVFEFTRLVLVGVIAQNYAEDGKATELGYRSYKAIGRIFYVTLLAGAARLVAAIAFDWARADEAFILVLGLGAHAVITFATYLCLSLSVLGQANALSDTVEVMEAARFASETDNLEVM